ncbi:FkbM family methyltransferase [Streptomyces tubbatahanensis]|uniref:FkbM family methyltransferase n=1 Tax=Streptomyces tubbatahanensis TaxID=2923272 RepID=A0ABY3XVI7_9ACTN|nr:FkbM family methyltransferase [Streptomyces tubbatahanensis]UNS98395.1 FkbM family methyltransferase [Streptomyces tubbatahanensis]
MGKRAAEFLAEAARWYVRYAPGRLEKPPLSRLLNEHFAQRPVRRTVTTRTGAAFEVDTEDLIQRYLYLFGVWEPHMTRWLTRRLRPGDGFVDVGANIGYFSVLASRLVGRTGAVTALEASPQFHRQALRNLRLNHCTNVRAVNAAVAAERQTLRFTLASSRNLGANSAVPWDGPAASSFEADAEPLARLLRSDEIERARVIKIDVEGGEGAAVRGLEPVLGRLRPDAEIAVEVAPARMAQLGDDAAELLRTMRGYGFHAYRLPNSYRPGSYPTALHAPHPPRRWHGPLPEVSDLVFSRTDAEVL